MKISNKTDENFSKLTVTDLLQRPAFQLVETAFLPNVHPPTAQVPENVYPRFVHLDPYLTRARKHRLIRLGRMGTKKNCRHERLSKND